MSLFPLYDEVMSKMDGKEKVLDKTSCSLITRMNQNHILIIYLIILHHYIQTNPNEMSLPYNSRTISNGKGIIFRKLKQIPDDLQKIIYRYLMMVQSK